MYDDFEGKVVLDLGTGTVCKPDWEGTLTACVMAAHQPGSSSSSSNLHHTPRPWHASLLCSAHFRGTFSPLTRHVCLLQGMLAIGAALLGSQAVLGVDIDADALEVAQRNCEQFEDPLPVSSSSSSMCTAAVEEALLLHAQPDSVSEVVGSVCWFCVLVLCLAPLTADVCS